LESPVIFTLGKYEIIGLLGEGGIAVVYRGYHREIDRYLAVKVLRPHYSQDPQFVERFKLEGRVIARLQHPHIVPLYDFGVQDDITYLATAYIQGGSLADIIAAGPMPLRQIDKVLREIISALDYAHRRGVVHRDIKPSNILIDAEGHALLADFGIVKIAGSGTTLTGTGSVLGTPAYISPEQGQARQVDGRADIYSLGVVAFEMLTGQRPFHARTPVEAIIMHVNAPVPRVTGFRYDLPPALNIVIQKAMSKRPEDRYQTGVEFYEDFTRIIHSDVSFVNIQAELRPQLETTEHARVRVDDASVRLTTIILEELQPVQRPAPARGLKLMALALLIGLAVVLGRFTIGSATTTFGSAAFSMSSIAGDTVHLEVQALPVLPDGDDYFAWLQNTGDGTTDRLGPLRLSESGSGSLTYTDPDGRILPSLYDAIIITQESDDDAVLYSGHLPSALSLALTEILFRSNNLPPEATTVSASYGPSAPPLNSLLDGALVEAFMGQMHTGLAADAPNPGSLHLHAEHTINIYLGTRDDYNGNGRGENPGRKIGVPFFLDRIEGVLSEAVNAPDTPSSVQDELAAILICNQNIRNWMDQIIAFEHDLLVASDIADVIPQKTESTQLATFILDGTDFNHNGEIEPIEGECGLQQITAYTQHMASMPLVQGPVEQS
jgi:hypothetical protein